MKFVVRINLSCAILLSLVIAASPAAHGQDSAPSSHFVFDDNFAGDIIINEVRVPKSGEAMYTYYEALGWGGKGAGYAGIQVHPKAHLYIFSIWDNDAHTAPIKAVHQGPGTEVVDFGGEGTGLKSWNFELGWNTDVWYTLVARTWPVGDHTHYGFWSRAGDTKRWTHLVTMDVATKTTFQGGTDAFIEDWLSTGSKPRTTHLRGGWKRKLDGTWFAMQRGRYSVNAWDLVNGKRSFNYRTNWDGGVAEDDNGKFFFMTAGGANTKPSTSNPSLHEIPRSNREPSYEKIKIDFVGASWANDGKLAVSWKVDETTAPQFSSQIQVFDNPEATGNPLVTVEAQIPHESSAKIDISSIDLIDEKFFVHLQCTDILDRPSDPAILEVTR